MTPKQIERVELILMETLIVEQKKHCAGPENNWQAITSTAHELLEWEKLNRL